MKMPQDSLTDVLGDIDDLSNIAAEVYLKNYRTMEEIEDILVPV